MKGDNFWKLIINCPCDYSFKNNLLHAFKQGTLYATSDLKGFAAWYPPNKVIMSLWDLLRCHLIKNLRKAKGRKIKKFLKFVNFEDQKHEEHANFPHWYLANIAVEPEYQKRGYGSMLLQEMLVTIDQQNLSCYLETQNQQNISMYKKFGFKLLEEAVIPNTEIEYYFMLRPKTSSK